MKEGSPMDKNYKRIDWSKRKPIEECISSGDTNGSHFDFVIDTDKNIPIISNSMEECIAVD